MHQSSRYLWSTICAWGLTIAVGALTVSGVLAMFMPLDAQGSATLRLCCVISFAAVAALALANANNAAAALMHAMSPRNERAQWSTLLPALVCALGFAAASVIGVHLGWEFLTVGQANAQLPDANWVWAAAGFLAFAKPAMAAVIEGRRAMDRADADAAEVADNARLDAIRQTDIAARAENVTHLRPRVRRTNTVAAGAAALASLAALGAPQTHAEAAPLVQQDAPSEMRAGASGAAGQMQAATPRRKPKTRASGAPRPSDADYETRAATARRLLVEAQHLSNREIARQAGLSPSTVDRLARALTPMAGLSAASA